MSIRTTFSASVRTIFAVACLLLGAACTSPDVSSSGDLSNTTVLSPTAADNSRKIDCSTPSIDRSMYRIGIGDSLAINVLRHDRLSVTVPVRPDGTITLPLAGEVFVDGRTLEEVDVEVTERFAKSIRNPLVHVVVLQSDNDDSFARIRITGAVRKPISLPSSCRGITVLEAVREAGGVDEDQYKGGACLYRRDGNRLPIDLDNLLNRTDMTSNLLIGGGDVLTVFNEKLLTESSAHCLTGKDWGT